MNLRSKAKAFYKGMIFRMSASNNPAFTAYYKHLYKPEKGSIDQFADFFSRSREQVTFVQIGANDGINNDPIHKFIKRDNWKGVLLEPQKFVYAKYLEPLYKKTPGIITLNMALDKMDGPRILFKIAISNSRWATGLASFNRSVLEEAIRSGYIERQANKEGCQLPVNREEIITEEIVECICPNTLIKRYLPEKTNWLQIDTEGFDFEIIKMFDIGTTQPFVIVYENLHFSPGQQKECTDHLKINGYDCIDFGPNTLAMLKPVTGFEQFFTRKL